MLRQRCAILCTALRTAGRGKRGHQMNFADLNFADFTVELTDFSQVAYEGDQIAMRLLWDNGGSSGECASRTRG